MGKSSGSAASFGRPRAAVRPGRRAVSFRPSSEGLESRALLSTAPAAAAHRADRAGAEVRPAAPAGGVRVLSNLDYLPPGGRQEHLDLYLPAGSPPPGGWPSILALPGGGWRWVRRGDIGREVAPFARSGYVVAVADYAYASSDPNSHVWPVNVEDVRQAVRWLRTNAGRFGIDPNRIAAYGESAGAHLANLLGTNPDGPLPDAGRGTASPPAVSARVEAVVDFYGPSDLARLYQENPRVRPYLQTFLGGSPDTQPDRYRAASPVNFVSPASPPFLIFQGTADTANLPDQSTELATALAKDHVPVSIQVLQGLPHGFSIRPGHGVDYTPLILSFLNSAMKKPAG